MSVSVAEPARMFVCPGCGDNIDLSAGSARQAEREGRQPVCRACRYPRVLVVTDALLEWWTSRYSERQLVELAEGMWGPREDWTRNPPQLRL